MIALLEFFAWCAGMPYPLPPVPPADRPHLPYRDAAGPEAS